MAKYRITSIPQSLPKAQKGLFKNKLDIKTPQNKFKNLFDKGVLDNKGYINLFGKNKKGNSTAPLWEAQSIPVFPSQESSIEDVMPKRTTEEQANVFPTINPDLSGSNTFQFKPSGVGINTDTGNCPNGQYFYRGQCVSEDVLYTIMLRENEIEDFQSSERINNTLNKIAEERARLAEEKENKDWEEMMQKRMLEEKGWTHSQTFIPDNNRGKRNMQPGGMEYLSRYSAGRGSPPYDPNHARHSQLEQQRRSFDTRALYGHMPTRMPSMSPDSRQQLRPTNTPSCSGSPPSTAAASMGATSVEP